jgi:hypothetical protein
VGFLLPSLLFLLFSMGLFKAYELKANAVSSTSVTSSTSINPFSLFENTGVETLINASLLLLVAWIGGVILVAINRELIRFMEGYGTLNPFRMFQCLERRKFDSISARVNSLKEKAAELNKNNQTLPEHLRKERRDKSLLLVERFPKTEFLLPTPFGNIMRSFETYPMTMYGVDAIVAWEKLLAVIPKDYRDYMDDAQSYVNFWLNLWYLLVVLFFEYLALTWHYKFTLIDWPWQFLIVFIFFCLVIWFVYSRASASAQRYGEFVKSAFDLYLPDLQKILGFIVPSSEEEARQQWQSFNQAILYVRPDLLPPRSYEQDRKSDED